MDHPIQARIPAIIIKKKKKEIALLFQFKVKNLDNLDKYESELKSLQYFGNVRNNSTALPQIFLPWL